MKSISQRKFYKRGAASPLATTRCYRFRMVPINQLTVSWLQMLCIALWFAENVAMVDAHDESNFHDERGARLSSNTTKVDVDYREESNGFSASSPALQFSIPVALLFFGMVLLVFFIAQWDTPTESATVATVVMEDSEDFENLKDTSHRSSPNMSSIEISTSV